MPLAPRIELPDSEQRTGYRLRILACRRGASQRLRTVVAVVLCGVIALECSSSVRLLMPVWKAILSTFNFKLYPNKPLQEMLAKDRHYLFAVSPHGFFPWGVGAILIK